MLKYNSIFNSFCDPVFHIIYINLMKTTYFILVSTRRGRLVLLKLTPAITMILVVSRILILIKISQNVIRTRLEIAPEVFFYFYTQKKKIFTIINRQFIYGKGVECTFVGTKKIDSKILLFDCTILQQYFLEFLFQILRKIDEITSCNVPGVHVRGSSRSRLKGKYEAAHFLMENSGLFL